MHYSKGKYIFSLEKNKADTFTDDLNIVDLQFRSWPAPRQGRMLPKPHELGLHFLFPMDMDPTHEKTIVAAYNYHHFTGVGKSAFPKGAS